MFQRIVRIVSRIWRFRCVPCGHVWLSNRIEVTCPRCRSVGIVSE